MKEWFARAAGRVSEASGSPFAFLAAALTVIIWAASGPFFHFTEVWQLVINTGTTIVTFLMVFLIQSAQNRDTKAIHLKLDELVRAVESARNEFIDAESRDDQWMRERRDELRGGQ